MIPRFMFMKKPTPVRYSSLLLITLVLSFTAVGCRTCDGYSKEKSRTSQESGRGNTNDGHVDSSDSPSPTKTKEIDGAECARLWKKIRKIRLDGCTNKGDRDLAANIWRSVHCACLKGEGHCCFYFAQAAAVARLSETIEMTSAIRHELYKKYWKKGCELGCPISCIGYREKTWSIDTKEIAKILETEPEMVKEIKWLCENGSYYACMQMVDIGSALYSVSKEKEKKETGLNLIHKYGKKFCSLHGIEGCSYYAIELVNAGRDLSVACDIFRHQCEELKNAASCSLAFQMLCGVEDRKLSYEEQFDFRWKSVMYSNEAHEMVDGWLHECYEDQGKPLKDRKYKKFAKKCIQWEKRLEEFERKKAKPEEEEEKRCNFSYKEFLCPDELIEPKEKRKVSPYLRIIKDHLEPPVSIQKLIDKSESKAEPKPKALVPTKNSSGTGKKDSVEKHAR